MIFFSQESFTSLLTDEEMQQLIENFDRLDVNQGNYMILVTIQNRTIQYNTIQHDTTRANTIQYNTQFKHIMSES